MSNIVTSSSSAIEEMIGNIQRSVDAVNNLDFATSAGESNLSEVSTLVEKIEQSSENLEEMSKVIQAISEQTNLLARQLKLPMLEKVEKDLPLLRTKLENLPTIQEQKLRKSQMFWLKSKK